MLRCPYVRAIIYTRVPAHVPDECRCESQSHHACDGHHGLVFLARALENSMTSTRDASHVATVAANRSAISNAARPLSFAATFSSTGT